MAPFRLRAPKPFGDVQNWIDKCTVMPYTNPSMKIRPTRHNGLKAFLENNDAKGFRPDQLKRVRNIFSALIHAENRDEMDGPPGWRLHQLTGDRAGTWSLSVSGNWRITFDLEAGEICNLNLEDYH